MSAPLPEGFHSMEEWDRRNEAVLLMVDYSDGGEHAIDDATVALTIGHNNDHNVGEGEGQGWQFAGWCWSHDHYTEGKGTPIGWAPLPHNAAREVENRRELESAGVTIDQIGGNCPVQAEGGFDGLRFYFRARGQSWQFHVAEFDADLLVSDKEHCCVIQPYAPLDGGDLQFAAGWMTEAEALGFILQEVRAFRARREAGEEHPR